MMLQNSAQSQAAAARASGRSISSSRKSLKPFTGTTSSSRAVRAAAAAAEEATATAVPSGLASPLTSISPLSSHDDFNQHVREGHYEAPLMQEQVGLAVVGQ